MNDKKEDTQEALSDEAIDRKRFKEELRDLEKVEDLEEEKGEELEISPVEEKMIEEKEAVVAVMEGRKAPGRFCDCSLCSEHRARIEARRPKNIAKLPPSREKDTKFQSKFLPELKVEARKKELEEKEKVAELTFKDIKEK